MTQIPRIQHNIGLADLSRAMNRKQELMRMSHYTSALEFHTLVVVSFIDREIYKLRDIATESGIYRHDIKKQVNIMVENIKELNQFCKMMEKDLLSDLTKNCLQYYRPIYDREYNMIITQTVQMLAFQNCADELSSFKAMTKNFCNKDKTLGKMQEFIGQTMIVNGLANVVVTTFNGFVEICEKFDVIPKGTEYAHKFKAIERATKALNSKYGVTDPEKEIDPFFEAAKGNLNKLSNSIITKVYEQLNETMDKIERSYIRWYFAYLIWQLCMGHEIVPDVREELRLAFGHGGRYLQLLKYLHQTARKITPEWEIEDIIEIIELRNHKTVNEYIDQIVDMKHDAYHREYKKIVKN